MYVQDYIFRVLANISNNHVSSFKSSFYYYLLRIRIKVWYFRASGQNPLSVKFLFSIKSSGFWSSWARFLWAHEENNLLTKENRYQWLVYDRAWGWLMPWISTLTVIVSNETKFFMCFFHLAWDPFREKRNYWLTYRPVANYTPLFPPRFRNEILEDCYTIVTLPLVISQVSLQIGKFESNDHHRQDGGQSIVAEVYNLPKKKEL